MTQVAFLATIFVAVFLGALALASIYADIRTARVVARRKLAEIATMDSGRTSDRWNVRKG